MLSLIDNFVLSLYYCLIGYSLIVLYWLFDCFFLLASIIAYYFICVYCIVYFCFFGCSFCRR